MPIIKSTLHASQNYDDYSKLQKGKPTRVATLVYGDNEVSQKQLEALKTLKVFKSQIEAGALVIGGAKDKRTEHEKSADEEAEAARVKLAQEAKEKAEAEAKELAAQKEIDEAAALAKEGGK